MFCRIRISFDKVLSVPGSGRRGDALVGKSDKSEHGRPVLIFATGAGSNESAQMRIDTLWHVVQVVASFEQRH